MRPSHHSPILLQKNTLPLHHFVLETTPNSRTDQLKHRRRLEGAEQTCVSMAEAGEDAEESPVEPAVAAEQTSASPCDRPCSHRGRMSWGSVVVSVLI
jgi:hypothetical protein